MDFELGCVGGGNMAEAIIKAAIDCGALEPDSIIVSDPAPERRAIFDDMGVMTTEDNSRTIGWASQILLAVKPQMLGDITQALREIDPEHQIILSILAGVSAAKIEEALGFEARIIRVMPNTPLLVGAGMSAIAAGPHAHQGDELLAMQIFGAAGEGVVVTEADMDAVTAVSGSGPAYAFYLAEAMTEAGLKLGLSDELAGLLTRQTIFGAAKLMKESDADPAELRRRVTSPGGTTQAAIEHMETTDIKTHIIDALTKAEARSKELGA
ncbi:MAG: pyrroline-5-carboxylate reductase [Planctomycetota bacterium]